MGIREAAGAGTRRERVGGPPRRARAVLAADRAQPVQQQDPLARSDSITSGCISRLSSR
jgi:hypothetical protein